MNMGHHLTKFFTKITTASLFSFIILSSQFSLAEIQLGNMSYGRINAPNLMRTASRGATFFRGVGGVAFEAVAKGEDGLKVTNLRYDSKAVDGDRLKLTISGKDGEFTNITGNIYDWQLVPIARFANTSYIAAMTLFGESSDPKLGEEILKTGGRIINYHKDFEDTLVGLRLFHADILIFQHNAVDLFKTKGGNYILGKGEIKPDLAANKDKFQKIKKVLEVSRSNGSTYASYVVGDLGQKVTFSVVGSKLKFAGTPYWWMWDNPARYKQDIEIVNAYSSYSELSGSESQLSARQALEFQYAKAILEGFLEEGGDFDALGKRLESYKESEIPVEHNSDLSQIVSQKVATLNGINPAVYATLKTVMHYAALFRHAKQTNSQRYASFLKSIEKVDFQPKVETPNVQYGVVH